MTTQLDVSQYTQLHVHTQRTSCVQEHAVRMFRYIKFELTVLLPVVQASLMQAAGSWSILTIVPRPVPPTGPSYSSFSRLPCLRLLALLALLPPLLLLFALLVFSALS
jgi:hypothetical protein